MAKKFDNVDKIIENVNSKEKRSIVKNLMTKYELDCVLNQRATQLSQGAYPFISKYKINDIEYNVNELKIDNNMELRKIAIEELKVGKLPIIIKRTYPNNTVDHIRVSEMDLTAVETLIR